MSTDSVAAFSDSIASPYRHHPRTSFSPTLGEPSSSWSDTLPSVPPGQLRSTKGKQPAPALDPMKSPFLSILYDREDCLRAVGESEDENEVEETADGSIDPRLLSPSTAFIAADASTRSPMETSSSQMPSPRKEMFAKSHGFTHLNNRQRIVDTVRIYPHLSLSNLFGNMPFSSSIRTNNYHSNVQDAQVNNLFLPVWAMMSINTRPDPGSLKNAFSFRQEATTMIENGTPVQLFIEEHPSIAALFDQDEYNNSGLISKWAAGMVHSARLKGMCIRISRASECLYSCIEGNVSRQRMLISER